MVLSSLRLQKCEFCGFFYEEKEVDLLRPKNNRSGFFQALKEEMSISLVVFVCPECVQQVERIKKTLGLQAYRM